MELEYSMQVTSCAVAKISFLILLYHQEYDKALVYFSPIFFISCLIAKFCQIQNVLFKW